MMVSIPAHGPMRSCCTPKSSYVSGGYTKSQTHPGDLRLQNLALSGLRLTLKAFGGGEGRAVWIRHCRTVKIQYKMGAVAVNQ